MSNYEYMKDEMEALYDSQNELLKRRLGFMGMTPIDEIDRSTFLPVENLPMRMRVHPRVLTQFTIPRTIGDNHRSVFGIAIFPSSDPSNGDRVRHELPHVPGANIELGMLGLVRATLDGLDAIAPLEKRLLRSHDKPVPADEEVLFELHDYKRGVLSGKKFGAVGTAIISARDPETGSQYAETIMHYRDLAKPISSQ